MKHAINTIVLLFSKWNEYYFAVILFQSHNFHRRFIFSKRTFSTTNVGEIPEYRTCIDCVDCFKRKLDKYLWIVPDEPQIPGYTAQVIDTHTHRHTDAGDDNIRRPKLASGNKNDDYQRPLFHLSKHRSFTKSFSKSFSKSVISSLIFVASILSYLRRSPGRWPCWSWTWVPTPADWGSLDAVVHPQCWSVLSTSGRTQHLKWRKRLNGSSSIHSIISSYSQSDGSERSTFSALP